LKPFSFDDFVGVFDVRIQILGFEVAEGVDVVGVDGSVVQECGGGAEEHLLLFEVFVLGGRLLGVVADREVLRVLETLRTAQLVEQQVLHDLVVV